MENNDVIGSLNAEISTLKLKVKELEQINLVLQEYFSFLPASGLTNSQLSPYTNKHSFSCATSFIIDLDLRKIVLSEAQDYDHFGFGKINFFLKDMGYFINKVVANSDRKKFKDLITSFYKYEISSAQSLIRLNSEKAPWSLVCFEIVNYENFSGTFLHVMFIKLEPQKELIEQFRELVKQDQREEQYQKIENLTGRQKEILSLLGKGLTSKEIASHLNISFHTVEAHRKSIAKKTQTRKRAALISLAAEVGIVG